jgi:hypothetical protein
VKQLEQVFKMKRRLACQAQVLGLSYSCEVKLMDYFAAEVRVEDGVAYAYPEMFGVIIENWNTFKGSFRLSDGRWVRESADLNSKGLTTPQIYRRMLKELKAHAKYIRLHNEARETNSVLFNGTLVVVENADAQERYHAETVFRLFEDNGQSSRWYGRSAEDALSNAYPWVKEKNLVMIQVEPNETKEA